MQLELTDNSNVTFYNPNPMSVLIQNFDQHEKRMLVSILYELKQHQGKRGKSKVDGDISISITNIRSKIGSPNGEDFLNSVKKLTSRTYSSIDTKKWEYFEGKPLFSEVIYDGRKGRPGHLTVTINRKLHDAWLNLSNGYTPQYLNKCLIMKGKYAPALYDFICKYDSPKTLSWRDLRTYLDINDSEYLDWQSFKKGVLIRSKAQIEKVTVRTFHYKVVKGERTEDLDIKKIKIWGELNPEVIPKDLRESILKLVKRLNYDYHKQALYIQEFIYENPQEFIEMYNEVLRYPDYNGITENDKRWLDVGKTILKRFRLG